MKISTNLVGYLPLSIEARALTLQLIEEVAEDKNGFPDPMHEIDFNKVCEKSGLTFYNVLFASSELSSLNVIKFLDNKDQTINFLYENFANYTRDCIAEKVNPIREDLASIDEYLLRWDLARK